MDHSVTTRTVDALGLVSQITRARTVAEAEHLLSRAIKPFGMEYYAAWIVSDVVENPIAGDTLPTLVTNWPDEWADAYFSARKYDFDPVVARASGDTGHFYWHDLPLPGAPDVLALIQDAAVLGMHDGLTVSWRSARMAPTILSVAGAPITWNETEEATMVAVAETFIQRVLDLKRQGGVLAVQSLSPQETRILYLCALGKSDKEIMRVLNLQRGTVLTHWSRIRLKLGAVDRTQAVAHGIASHQVVF